MDHCKLTMICEHGGCAGKADADSLERILDLWQVGPDAQVLLGLKERDDAGVYDLGNGQALVHSVDVITPVVDDAEAFGRIAVSHALSDVYAKGARPISALSVLGFRSNDESALYLGQILSGCSAKLREAGVALLGGHTVLTRDLLLGFAVTGIVKTNAFLALRGASVGDRLVLTKAIGSGIISTAQRLSNLNTPGVSLSEVELAEAISSMALLNDRASRLMIECGAKASTDVSGFGLLGHLANLVRASSVGARISFSAVPRLDGAMRLLSDAIAPARIDENLSHYQDAVTIASDVDSRWPILYCPETSGGLLVALREKEAEAYVERIKALAVTEAAIIGEIVDDSSGGIRVVA
jgi:selenide,water dikinase